MGTTRKVKPWEQQPDESMKAYEAFSTYLEMGSDRSCAKVAKKLGKSTTIIERWSSRWQWQYRIREHENEKRRIEFETYRKEYKKMQKRQIQMATLMQKKALDALNKINPEELSAIEILKYFAEGSKIEKELREELQI